MRVMIVVTHLLGTGHLSRALVLARAINAAGHQSTVVSGGFPAPHLDQSDVTLCQLPPIRSDGVQFTRLLDDTGAPAQNAYMSKRRIALLHAFDALSPDVVVTELFPFGRRVLRDEFIALLEHAHKQTPRPRIAASIRDILAPPSKSGKAETAAALVNQYYDAVLVHSDEQITPLSASWPVTPALARKLLYTGYVAPSAAGAHPDRLGQGRVIVSVGGGAVGGPLLETALEAAKRDETLQWHLLVGGKDAAAKSASYAITASPSVTIEPARPDFRQMLCHAAASVSLCGYNTALDILQAGTPAVFVPFDEGGEVEQTLRAQQLAKLPGIALLPAAKLSAQSLYEAVLNAMAAPPRAPIHAVFDGAAQTVGCLETLLESRPDAH